MGATSSLQRPYTVYMDGVFDLPHSGHKATLWKAYRAGVARAANDPRYDSVRVLVGVCDEGVADYKREPIMSVLERVESVRRLGQGQLPLEVLGKGVPLRVTQEFLRDHQVDLVVHGDDFSQEELEKYYGEVRQVAEFTTVPYSEGPSTTEILTKAKTKGKLGIDGGHLAVAKEELVERIKKRTWRQLRISDPTFMGRLRAKDMSVFNQNYAYGQVAKKRRGLLNAVGLSGNSLRSFAMGSAYVTADFAARAFGSVKNRRNEMGNLQLLLARVTEVVRDLAGTVFAGPVAVVSSPEKAVQLFGVKGESYMVPSLSPREAADVYAVAYGVLRYCESHGLECRMTSGTFLGALREGGVIAWDDDIDLFIHPDSGAGLREGAESGDFERETGLGIAWQPFTQGFQAYFKDNKEGPSVLGDVRPPFVDLFLTEMNPDGTITYQAATQESLASNEYYTDEEWNQTKDYPFGPIFIKGPANPHPYFERCFGEEAMEFAYQVLDHMTLRPKAWPQRVKIVDREPIRYDHAHFEARIQEIDRRMKLKA